MPLQIGDRVTITLLRPKDGTVLTPLAAEVTHTFNGCVYVDYMDPSTDEWKSAKLLEFTE
jgi:hypothetical protein